MFPLKAKTYIAKKSHITLKITFLVSLHHSHQISTVSAYLSKMFPPTNPLRRRSKRLNTDNEQQLNGLTVARRRKGRPKGSKRGRSRPKRPSKGKNLADNIATVALGRGRTPKRGSTQNTEQNQPIENQPLDSSLPDVPVDNPEQQASNADSYEEILSLCEGYQVMDII